MEKYCIFVHFGYIDSNLLSKFELNELDYFLANPLTWDVFVEPTGPMEFNISH